MASDIKDYILKAAENYEKHGFLLEAAQLYQKTNPGKAKEMYLKVAEKADRHKLWALLADCYEYLGDEEKARSVWKKVARGLKSENAPKQLIEEALGRSKPPDKKFDRRREFSRKAVFLEGNGKFEESKKVWEESAKIEEKEGDLKFAAKLYSNACLLKDAKRCWENKS